MSLVVIQWLAESSRQCKVAFLLRRATDNRQITRAAPERLVLVRSTHLGR
jgi:hypothetical protein